MADNTAVTRQPAAGPSAATPAGVPVGVATKTGYGVALAGLIGAALAYATGDHSQSQLGSIVGASVGLISLTITQIGRYVQANSSIKANVELKRVEAESKSLAGDVNQVDPRAAAQVRELVRGFVHDEISSLPAGDRTVATNVENILLPTAEEEAAAQPPATPSLVSGGT